MYLRKSQCGSTLFSSCSLGLKVMRRQQFLAVLDENRASAPRHAQSLVCIYANGVGSLHALKFSPCLITRTCFRSWLIYRFAANLLAKHEESSVSSVHVKPKVFFLRDICHAASELHETLLCCGNFLACSKGQWSLYSLFLPCQLSRKDSNLVFCKEKNVIEEQQFVFSLVCLDCSFQLIWIHSERLIHRNVANDGFAQANHMNCLLAMKIKESYVWSYNYLGDAMVRMRTDINDALLQVSVVNLIVIPTCQDAQ